MSSTITVPVTGTSTQTERPAERLHRTTGAVRLAFVWWGVRKTLTSQQKEEIGISYDADARFLSAGKKLVDTKHEAFATLTTIKTAIVAHWKKITLPYVDKGVRLIRQCDIDGFARHMEEQRAELRRAEADLAAVFDDIRERARQQLGRLFDAADYPANILGLFDVAWDFPSVEPPNYLMELAPELYEQERQRIVRRFEESVQLAEDAFITEFDRLVSHLTQCLATTGPDGEKKIFRDSTITNVRAFIDRFRVLNVRSNAQLDALVEQAASIVGGIQPDQLRRSDDIRQFVASRMAGVQASLDGLMVNVNLPRRRIIRSNGGPDASES